MSGSNYIIEQLPPANQYRQSINESYLVDEALHVSNLLKQAQLTKEQSTRVNRRARELVRKVRQSAENQGAMEAFMREYDLSSEEGVVLMCLAEALLRIPDSDTAEKLIADKLADANWEAHLGKSSSLFVNASTWGLMLTGRLVRVGTSTRRDLGTTLAKIANKSGEPVLRLAIRQAMRIMGFQYVMGRTIAEALERAEKKQNRGYRYSFDMLGEAALTAEDAAGYQESYRDAIAAIGAGYDGDDIFAAPSISVKLSALHPRYDFSQRDRVMRELPARLSELVYLAREHNVGITIDAEEADRLMLSLDVFAEVFNDAGLAGWNGLGLALQSYLKRCPAVIDWLANLAKAQQRRIPVRLVKGAYWDTEIKECQVNGLAGYPVYTRKVNTDIAFITCARKLLGNRQAFYPQFASHNAHTIAVICELAGDRLDYEFQRLHGMGEGLYGEVTCKNGFHEYCRVYAPVGSHEELLPYLVRRLLENGANTSFVNRIVDENLPVEKVAEDPFKRIAALEQLPHPGIPLPGDIFGDQRRNSSGVNLADEIQQSLLSRQVMEAAAKPRHAAPLVASLNGKKNGKRNTGRDIPVTDPANHSRHAGTVIESSAEQVEEALTTAWAFTEQWQHTPVEERASALERAADLIEEQRGDFIALCAREAGKTVFDAIDEVREAVDFLRYYAGQARNLFSRPLEMPGPTGESNQLFLYGRGVFACISPWNFPLAIFTGQVAAALVAGNTVLAKPAGQTPLIAHLATTLLHDAGIPRQALQYLPGGGSTVGARLTSDPRIAGVVFTGSMDTARAIASSLLQRDAPLAPLIAETGGQNVMIVDSSALPEQVVQDVISSAFHSAGQRCSALRILYLQEEIADHTIKLLTGAMQELVLGNPALLVTDIGPVIDKAAQKVLKEHTRRMDREARFLGRAPLPEYLQQGSFFAPCVYEIESLEQLTEEVFGPVLHVIRFRSNELDEVIDSINNSGYGLTLGVHSRIDRTQEQIAQRVRVGNIYVNRSMTGAVVGVQPFGGEGLSGTGPKAGGPNYLMRFVTERTLTVNIAAVGGNASLLALED